MKNVYLVLFLVFTSITIVGNTGVVHAVGGLAVTAAGNEWAPYGPFVTGLQFKTYAGVAAEVFDFGLGNLDLADGPASPVLIAGCGPAAADWILSPPDPGTGAQTCALKDIGGVLPLSPASAGLVNSLGQGYPNFWTALNGQDNPGFVPLDPIYTFGGGANVMRWGLRAPIAFLNPFHAATAPELATIYEVYDTLFKANPINPSQVICWMCYAWSTSVDPMGNTDILISLKQNLRWHDGPQVTSLDVKFTILNFLNVPIASASIFADVAGVLSVTALSPNVLAIKMAGVDAPACAAGGTCFVQKLAGVPIIPLHLWDGFPDLFYGDVGKADPVFTAIGFDPVIAGFFIGSGPFVCRSVFGVDLNAVGKGCTWNAGIIRTGQIVVGGGSIRLQRFDRTGDVGTVDPFLQYHRSYNTAWGMSAGIPEQSGQFEEWSWADSDNDNEVSISDLVSVGACFGLVAPAPSCPAATLTYWDVLGPVGVTTEVFVVASHLDDTFVYPYPWAPASLTNIVPFTP